VKLREIYRLEKLQRIFQWQQIKMLNALRCKNGWLKNKQRMVPLLLNSKYGVIWRMRRKTLTSGENTKLLPRTYRWDSPSRKPGWPVPRPSSIWSIWPSLQETPSTQQRLLLLLPPKPPFREPQMKQLLLQQLPACKQMLMVSTQTLLRNKPLLTIKILIRELLLLLRKQKQI